jgi:hypothetical protein
VGAAALRELALAGSLSEWGSRALCVVLLPGLLAVETLRAKLALPWGAPAATPRGLLDAAVASHAEALATASAAQAGRTRLGLLAAQASALRGGLTSSEADAVDAAAGAAAAEALMALASGPASAAAGDSPDGTVYSAASMFIVPQPQPQPQLGQPPREPPFSLVPVAGGGGGGPLPTHHELPDGSPVSSDGDDGSGGRTRSASAGGAGLSARSVGGGGSGSSTSASGAAPRRGAAAQPALQVERMPQPMRSLDARPEPRASPRVGASAVVASAAACRSPLPPAVGCMIRRPRRSWAASRRTPPSTGTTSATPRS